MAGTVTSQIGTAGVFFEYAGTGAALHMDIGFQPSYVEFKASTLSWTWQKFQGYADIATINGWVLGVAGTGAAVGTLTSPASINGIQVATDVTVNAAGYTYRGVCFR